MSWGSKRGSEQRSSRAAPFPGDRDETTWLTVGGWAATGAGVASLLGLLSVIPWPELFSMDARPATAVALEPGLKVALVGHYVILVAGAACGLVAAVTLGIALRRRTTVLTGALMLAVASAALLYATTARAIDLTVNDGRATVDVETVVWGGGGTLLVAVVVLTLALRRQAGTGFLLLGLGAPLLVAAGLTMFALVGPDLYPDIWGVTFPPPSDYLLAIWFILLGRRMRTGAQEVASDGPADVRP